VHKKGTKKKRKSGEVQVEWGEVEKKSPQAERTTQAGDARGGGAVEMEQQ